MISKISHNEAISAFIKGLRFHEALRNKLLRKRPTTMAELLATAKNYTDADNAEKLIRDDARGPDQPPRRDDSRGRFDNRNHRRPDNREGWDRWRDNRDDFRGKRRAITKTRTRTRIGTHDTSMSVPPTWSTPSSGAKFPSSLSEKESS